MMNGAMFGNRNSFSICIQTPYTLEFELSYVSLSLKNLIKDTMLTIEKIETMIQYGKPNSQLFNALLQQRKFLKELADSADMRKTEILGILNKAMTKVAYEFSGYDDEKKKLIYETFNKLEEQVMQILEKELK